MKWGIRRNSRVLANHRRNDAVRSIKNDYDLGKITKDKKRSLIKAENKKKRAFIKKIITIVKQQKFRVIFVNDTTRLLKKPKAKSIELD